MCGCNRSFRATRSAPALRPANTRPIRTQSNNQIIALGTQTNTGSIKQLDAARRQTERLRREARQRALNK